MADFAKNSTKSEWVPLTAALGWLDEYINDLQRERTECREQLSRVLKTVCGATVENKIMQKITQTWTGTTWHKSHHRTKGHDTSKVYATTSVATE